MKRIKLLIGIASAALAMMTTTQAQTFVTNGLVAYYPFNGNANDASGNGNNGITNLISFSSGRFSAGNDSILISGPNSYVLAPRSQTLDIDGQITISTWIKNGSETNLIGGTILAKGVLRGFWNYNISYNGQYFGYGKSSGSIGVNIGFLNTNQWHNLVVSLNETINSIAFYLDGVQLTNVVNYSGSFLPSDVSNAISDTGFGGDLIIGSNNTNGENGYFNGAIDDVRIYNRALSSNDVAALYALESTPPITITSQPATTTNNIGDTINFTVGISNSYPVTYQWSKDGITLNGKTNATLTITNVQPVNIGAYSVVVSDAYGNTVTSSNATLSLNGVNSGIWSNLVAYYPFNGNPNDASGYGNDGSGFNLQFTTNGILGQAAILDGSAGITVPESSSLHLGTQFTISCWVRIANWDGRNVNTGHPIISAGGIVGQSETAFGAGLTEWSSDLNFHGANDYPVNSQCLFSRSYSPNADISNIANGPPNTKLDIQTNRWQMLTWVYNGQTVMAFLDGVRLQEYVYTNAINISPYQGWQTMRIGFDHGLNTLKFVGALDNLRIFNRAVSSNDVAALYASELPTYPPTITTNPADSYATGNQPASFNVAATGSGTLSYQWQFNGTNLLNATNSVLNIASAKPSNIGQYNVVVTNAYGSATSSIANLFMYPYLSSPFNGLITYWGQTNTLSVGAWGSGALSYQWYFNGVAIDGATASTLPLGAIQFTNAGQYSVVVSSGLGSVTNAPYQVVVNPANVSVAICPNVVIQGTVGYSYVIQSTTDLSNTNSWMVETNITLTQPIQFWDDTAVDTSKSGNSHKFYRLVAGQ
jgi:Concanavalin A-like lectin/glucanases superfamily/Immunoglobulin domain/Immunoglobulin I-set domain